MKDDESVESLCFCILDLILVWTPTMYEWCNAFVCVNAVVYFKKVIVQTYMDTLHRSGQQQGSQNSHSILIVYTKHTYHTYLSELLKVNRVVQRWKVSSKQFLWSILSSKQTNVHLAPCTCTSAQRHCRKESFLHCSKTLWLSVLLLSPGIGYYNGW